MSIIQNSECLKPEHLDFRQRIQISDIRDFWDTNKMFRFQHVQISDRCRQPYFILSHHTTYDGALGAQLRFQTFFPVHSSDGNLVPDELHSVSRKNVVFECKINFDSIWVLDIESEQINLHSSAVNGNQKREAVYFLN